MIKNLKEWWIERRDSIGLFSAGLLVFAALYLTKLGSLVPGNSMFERPDFLGITSKHDLLEQVVFLPLKILQAVMVKIDDPNATLLRLLSTVVILASLMSVYFVMERWHTRRIAALSTFMMASSTYVLQLGRFSAHEVLYISVVPFILLMGEWLRSKRHVCKLPVTLIVSALLLYIPGVWILLVPLAIFFNKRVRLAWKFVDHKHRIAGIAGFILAAAPLLYSLVRYPSQLPVVLGIDRATAGNITQVLEQFVELSKQIFLRGPNEPFKWLVGTPVLDIATVILAVLGVYSYIRGQHPLRARLLGLFIIVGVIVAATSMYATLALLLPVIYILAANGIAYLLQSWFTVFPRNPAARSVGVACVIVLVGIVAAYHVKRYYFAWPNAPATKQALSPDSHK